MENLLILNVDKICRICLIEGVSMRSIYSSLSEDEILEQNVFTLGEVLSKITSISIDNNDGFPTQICRNCTLLIQGAYKFKIQFQQSYSILQEYVSTKPIKQELTDYNETDESNVVDQFIDTIAKAQEAVTDKHLTNGRQIQNRLPKTTRRSRRTKRKPSLTESDENNDDEIESTNVNTKTLHPCPICTKEFTALELREHAHTHKALKKYLSIPTIHKVSPSVQFYRKYDPEKTTTSIHKRIVKLHKCVLCEEELTASNLRVHMENHRNQKEYKCDQCTRVFKKLNHLNTHRVKHLKEFPFKCEHCEKGFVIKKNYDCHILTHNTNQELPHECSHCLRRFSNPEHLNRHIIIHTENVTYSVKYRVCKCRLCLKTFKDREELRSHSCVPIAQKNNVKFPCKICHKDFKNSSGLYNHTRNIHKLKSAKILCSVCGVYVSNIYNHMMRHTGEKPFQCNQCGKRFIGKPQLRQHLLVHSGLKPYVCSMCAKAFNNLYNLQVHERIHKGDRCHICTICNKGFLEKSYLKKHMNVHAKL